MTKIHHSTALEGIYDNIRRCPLQPNNISDIGALEWGHVIPMYSGAIFYKGRATRNLCSEKHECHRNAKNYAKNNQVCAFTGYGHSSTKKDEYVGWYSHSWLVTKDGVILETWSDDTDGYYGIPDYLNTPKSNWKICKKAYQVLKKLDNTNGCKI